MNIIEAEKELESLHKEMAVIREEYCCGSWAKHCGRLKRKPLEDRADKLVLAIIKAKEITEIEI